MLFLWRVPIRAFTFGTFLHRTARLLLSVDILLKVFQGWFFKETNVMKIVRGWRRKQKNLSS